jgi:hypothetical protein
MPVITRAKLFHGATASATAAKPPTSTHWDPLEVNSKELLIDGSAMLTMVVSTTAKTTAHNTASAVRPRARSMPRI